MAAVRSCGLTAAPLVLGLLSCSRPTAAPAEAGAEGPVDAPVALKDQELPGATGTPSAADPIQDPVPPLPAGEARRSTIARLEADALLRAQLGVLRDHFGADAKGPYDEQRVDLAGGRTAVMVSRTGERDPIVLVVDREEIVWSKLRPTGGILPPVRHLALAPRPDGGAAVFGWVEGLRTVAARMWADDSNPFGDFELFEADGCDALSAGYAPGQGWVVACASRTGTRVQRMKDDGTLAWGRNGVPLGAASPEPVTIVWDTRSTLMLLQREAAPGGDRFLAFRYDMNARDMWAAPVDLGISARTTAASERIEAASVRDGVVRVKAPRRAPGTGPPVVEVDSSGKVRPASP